MKAMNVLIGAAALSMPLASLGSLDWDGGTYRTKFRHEGMTWQRGGGSFVDDVTARGWYAESSNPDVPDDIYYGKGRNHRAGFHTAPGTVNQLAFGMVPGGWPSGSADLAMEFRLTNVWTDPIDSFEFLYDGVQFREGRLDSQTMTFAYQVGGGPWVSPGWDFTSLLTGEYLNIVAFGPDIGGTASGLGWDPGEELTFRWEFDAPVDGYSHGLGVTNVRFTTIPAPASAALLIGLVFATRRIRGTRPRAPSARASGDPAPASGSRPRR